MLGINKTHFSSVGCPSCFPLRKCACWIGLQFIYILHLFILYICWSIANSSLIANTTISRAPRISHSALAFFIRSLMWLSLHAAKTEVMVNLSDVTAVIGTSQQDFLNWYIPLQNPKTFHADFAFYLADCN